MVCQDGFITSHSVENVNVLADKKVKTFIKTYKLKYPLLNTDKPVTMGPLDLFDYYFEHKRQQVFAMEETKKQFKIIAKEFSKLIGKKYDFFETYKLNDADFAIVVMSSTAGTTKYVVDELRKKGIKAGLLKLRLFRPFPDKEIATALKKVKAIAVLDRALYFGSFPPLFGEIRNALFNLPKKPPIVSYVFGLGGRDIKTDQIKSVFMDLKKISKSKKITKLINFIGVRNG
jgi:pyruvate ferredoxin oxidoreductase alpha subunit